MIRELKIGSARRMAVGGANAMIERGEVCCILKMCTSSILTPIINLIKRKNRNTEQSNSNKNKATFNVLTI